MEDNIQIAPFPSDLNELVKECKLNPNWQVWMEHRDRGQGSKGLTLVILTHGYDSYHPDRGQSYGVHHYFPVPPAAYDRRSWQRWLFNQYLLVCEHEAMEFFQIDGKRPYAPSHGPGNDPYLIREIGTEVDVNTSFRGVVRTPS